MSSRGTTDQERAWWDLFPVEKSCFSKVVEPWLNYRHLFWNIHSKVNWFLLYIFLTSFSAHSLFLCCLEHVGYCLCFSTIFSRCKEKGNAHRAAATRTKTKQALVWGLWERATAMLCGFLPKTPENRPISLYCLAFNTLLVKNQKSQRLKNQTKKDTTEEGIPTLLLSGCRADMFLLRWELGWKLDNAPNNHVVLHDVWPAIMDQDGPGLRCLLLK